MEKFIRSIHDIHPLPDHDLKLLLDTGIRTDIPKGHMLFREGEVDRSIYLIRSGVLRGYWDGEDRETTIWFATEGEAAFSSWSYAGGQPSQISVTASCDCRLLFYEKEKIEALFRSSAELAVWGRKLFERLLLSSDQWLVYFSKPLAADRYKIMAEKMPEILQNVPLKEIASYLGVTPQSLSRIRSELFKK